MSSLLGSAIRLYRCYKYVPLVLLSCCFESLTHHLAPDKWRLAMGLYVVSVCIVPVMTDFCLFTTGTFVIAVCILCVTFLVLQT